MSDRLVMSQIHPAFNGRLGFSFTFMFTSWLDIGCSTFAHYLGFYWSARLSSDAAGELILMMLESLLFHFTV